MPLPGDKITADYQAELDGVLIGGADSTLAAPGISGVGVPTPKSADVDLALADGSYGSPDYKASPTITVPILIDKPTAAAAWTVFAALRDAWSPKAADEELHLQIPGPGHIFYTGRPRGLAEDLSLLSEGVINCMGTFVALNPVPAAYFTPATISGLVLWAEADAITGLVDGDAVTTWSDASGGARHLTQATAGQKPTYKANILDGEPVVRFDGGDSLAATFTALPRPLTTFVVGKATVSTGADQILFGSGSSAYIYRDLNGPAKASGGSATVTSGSMALGSWYVLQTLWTSTLEALRLNGGAAVSAAVAASNTYADFKLGGGSPSFLNGDIAAVIVYNAALSVADLNRVGGYLAAKYGVTWATAT